MKIIALSSDERPRTDIVNYGPEFKRPYFGSLIILIFSRNSRKFHRSNSVEPMPCISANLRTYPVTGLKRSNILSNLLLHSQLGGPFVAVLKLRHFRLRIAPHGAAQLRCAALQTQELPGYLPSCDGSFVAIADLRGSSDERRVGWG